jgi:hypothetical protein
MQGEPLTCSVDLHILFQENKIRCSACVVAYLPNPIVTDACQTPSRNWSVLHTLPPATSSNGQKQTEAGHSSNSCSCVPPHVHSYSA